ncbi:MAG TPA: hypothetical protein VFB62_19940 [Polyangiaceae bacterium]|nr:hypothetical protein [Polyangiaceae bacterium]
MTELIYQALETEIGGVEVYETALECVQNAKLKKELTRYHEETKRHVDIVRELCEELSLNPDEDTPGRQIVRQKGKALVAAMQKALEEGDPAAAELVALECVVDAETKDHQNWELIGEAAKRADADTKHALTKAYEEVEDEEDEHLYHTKGWARELWLKSLGIRAVLPPPEEQKDVKTAIGAARAKQQRSRMRAH